MSVAKDCLITLALRISDESGHVLDAGDAPISYLHGGYGALFPKLEAALAGKAVGDCVQLTLAAEDAFGAVDPDLILDLPLDGFANPPRLGEELQQDYQGLVMTYRVAAIADGQARLDANPAWAGMALCCQAEIRAIRPRDAKELAQEISQLRQSARQGQARALAAARICEDFQEATDSARLAQAEAADLVQTTYIPRLGLRLRFIFRSQTHKLCWWALSLILPAIATWVVMQGDEIGGLMVALGWLAWFFLSPFLIGKAIDRWGYRFGFVDFSPNYSPSRLEKGLIDVGIGVGVLVFLGLNVLGLIKLEHLSDLWELLIVDVAMLFVLWGVLGILLPFLIMVLTGFRVRPVIDKKVAAPS